MFHDGNADQWLVKTVEKLKKSGERGLRFREKKTRGKKEDVLMKKRQS